MGVEEYIPPTGEEALNKKLEPYGITYDDLKRLGVYPKDGEYEFIPSFNTPTGKIELYSTLFEKYGYDPFPDWKEELSPPKPDEKFPFYFTTTRPPVHRHTMTQNNPGLSEIYPENKVWINKSVAKKKGIKEGEEVYVASKYGFIKVKAYLTEGIRPDTVCVAHGFGHWSKYLSVAKGKGGNDGDIEPARTLEEEIEMNDPFAPSADCDVVVGIYKKCPPLPTETKENAPKAPQRSVPSPKPQPRHPTPPPSQPEVEESC